MNKGKKDEYRYREDEKKKRKNWRITINWKVLRSKIS